MRHVLVFSLILVAFSNCKSQQYTIDDLPESQLVFGKGGGITGAVDTYVLLENGQFFKSNSLTNEHSELESIKKKEAKRFFKKLDSLALSEYDFNHPGNRYYFLEQVKGEEVHRVTWGSKDQEISEAYKLFYEELKNTIK